MSTTAIQERAAGSPVYLIVHWPDGSEGKIGTWFTPGANNDNFDQQKDIGWHIMLSLQQGCERIEIVSGEIQP